MSLKLGIYSFWVALSLCCCVGFSCSEQRLLCHAVHRLLVVVASRCRAQALGMPALVVTAGSVIAALRLCSVGSAAVAHRPRCPAACGILLDQGLSLCLLHWQADSHPLCHQGRLKWVHFAHSLETSLPRCHTDRSEDGSTQYLLIETDGTPASSSLHLGLLICDEDLPQQFSERAKERNTFEKYVGSCEISLVWPLL